MAGQDDGGLQSGDAGQGGVEVEYLKPRQHAVAMRQLRIADEAVMILHIPAVQLQHQPSVRNEPFVIRPAMFAAAAEPALIPAVASFHLAHADEGL